MFKAEALLFPVCSFCMHFILEATEAKIMAYNLGGHTDFINNYVGSEFSYVWVNIFASYEIPDFLNTTTKIVLLSAMKKT